MSRSGYNDDCEDDLAFGRYRGVVASATRGMTRAWAVEGSIKVVWF